MRGMRARSCHRFADPAPGPRAASTCWRGRRVALAYFEDADAERYLAGAPFPAYNENTLVSVEQLREDIRLTRERGYALSDEDVTLGVGAVGVPIVDNESGRVIASCPPVDSWTKC